MHPDEPTDSIVVDDLMVLLPALLRSIDALRFVSRHLNPLELPAILQAIGAPDEELRAACAPPAQWPERNRRFLPMRNCG